MSLHPSLIISSFTTANGSFEFKPKKSLSILDANTRLQKQEAHLKSKTNIHFLYPPTASFLTWTLETEAKQKQKKLSNTAKGKRLKEINLLAQCRSGSMLLWDLHRSFSPVSLKEDNFISRWSSYRYVRLGDRLVRCPTTCVGLYSHTTVFDSHRSVELQHFCTTKIVILILTRVSNTWRVWLVNLNWGPMVGFQWILRSSVV